MGSVVETDMEMERAKIAKLFFEADGDTAVKVVLKSEEAREKSASVIGMDEELLQEQTQVICEELQRRGACTTLALAKVLGLEKSTHLNPLLFLLLEKNVVVRVTDLPPIWSLSPTFPMKTPSLTPPPSPAAAVQARNSTTAAVIPNFQHTTPPHASAVAPVVHHVISHFPDEPVRPANPHVSVAGTPKPGQLPRITFPPVPPLPSDPAVISAVTSQQYGADFWPLHGNNRDGGNSGPVTPFKKWKKQKNLSELQLRLLQELRERGPTKTLQLSKIVGLVTCRDINPSLYDLKRKNLVTRVSQVPPVWQLKEPGLSRPQQGFVSRVSDMDADEDDDFSENENQLTPQMGVDPLAVNHQMQLTYQSCH